MEHARTSSGWKKNSYASQAHASTGSCFDKLSMNGKSAIISTYLPFALSLSKGERRVFPHLLMSETRLQVLRGSGRKAVRIMFDVKI